MRLPTLFALYLASTAAAIGAQPAMFRIHRLRERLMPVNSENALESTPERHPGPENPYGSPSLCVDDYGIEYDKNGQLATVGKIASSRSFARDIRAQFCSIGNDGTVYLVGKSVGVNPWADDSQNWLRAYTRTGDLKWSVLTNEYRSPPAIAAHARVYMISMPKSGNTQLTAYDADGSVLWSADTGGFEWNPVPPVIGRDGTVYLYSGVQSAPAIIAISPGGTRLWSASVPAPVSQLAVTPDDRLLVIVPSGNLLAFDTQGDRLWSFYSGGRTQGDGVAVAADGIAYFASGFVFALDKSGKTRWTFKSELTYTQSDYFSENPIVAEDATVYISSFLHQLYAISPDGHKKWVFRGEATGQPDAIMLTSSGILRTQHGWFLVSAGLASHGWPAANANARNTRSAEAQ